MNSELLYLLTTITLAAYEDQSASRFRGLIVKSSAINRKFIFAFTKLKLFWHLRKRSSEDLEHNAVLMSDHTEEAYINQWSPAFGDCITEVYLN